MAMTGAIEKGTYIKLPDLVKCRYDAFDVANARAIACDGTMKAYWWRHRLCQTITIRDKSSPPCTAADVAGGLC